jgi:hypothetical protein
MYGERDRDDETNSYVKTRFVTVFFIPIQPISAFSVADAPKGWYFIGKEPLTVWDRTWNVLVGAGAIALAAIVRIML